MKAKKFPRASAAMAAVQNIKAAPSQMTAEDAADIETKYRQDPLGLARRMALALLTQTGADLIDTVRNADEEAALGVAQTEQGIRQYAEQLRSLALMMDAAALRCQVALAHRTDAMRLWRAASQMSGASAQS